MNEERKPTIDDRLQALTMNLELVTHDVEMLVGSTKDMRVVAEVLRERDANYIRLIRDILDQWAGKERNGQ